MNRKHMVLVCAVLGTVGLAGGLWWSIARDPSRVPSPTPGTPWFEDATEKLGIDFVHDAGPVGNYFMPQQVGSGIGLFDFDDDGRLDLYLLQNAGAKSGVRNRLYRQTDSGKFIDVSEGSGLDIEDYCMGVAVGDINNDGLPDVLVTRYSGVACFLNLGEGKFRDISGTVGIDNPGWGTSAAFFDYDRDGWLDLVVVNYVDYDPTWSCTGSDGKPDYCAPKNFRGRVSRLYHNLGNTKFSRAKDGVPPATRVRFEDVTEKSGFAREASAGLGVVTADFTGDDWIDVLIANDGRANHLWVNQKDGTFREEAGPRGLAYNFMGRTEADMGIALGDIDGDLLLDVFVTHLTEETHTYWRQSPPGMFQDRTSRTRLLTAEHNGTGFGTVFSDFDHDGNLDLAVVNGRVSALDKTKVKDWSLGPFWSRYGEQNQLFSGSGKQTFEDISASTPALCGSPNIGRALARGDIDGDGDLDLVVLSIGGAVRVFENVAPRRGHWLRVRAIDPSSNRDALGTRVVVVSKGRSWVSWLHPAESYLCSCEPVAHFGLGDVDQMQRVELTWPDGSRESFPCTEVNRSLTLRKGEGSPVPNQGAAK